MTTSAGLRASINHRARKKEWAIRILGGQCLFCGDINNLEFDHIDPSAKTFTIGSNLGRSKAVLRAELSKCRLLCHECHMQHTILQRNQNPAKHGTAGFYSNHGCRCISCKIAWSVYMKTRVWS